MAASFPISYLLPLYLQFNNHLNNSFHFKETRVSKILQSDWSKAFLGGLPMNCFSEFDHFVKLALKGLTNTLIIWSKDFSWFSFLTKIKFWRDLYGLQSIVLRIGKFPVHILMIHSAWPWNPNLLPDSLWLLHQKGNSAVINTGRMTLLLFQWP